MEKITALHPQYNWKQNRMTDAVLKATHFPPPTYIIDKLIPQGLTILAGKPKIGKSWFALDIARTIGSKAATCFGRNTAHGATIYLALEDDPSRLHWRIKKIDTADHDASNTEYFNRWRELQNGGLNDLEEWRNETPNATLAIIDTLAALRNNKPNEQSYLGDYKALQGLQQWSNQNKVAVLLLHHTRKQEADDPLDEISGTLAIGGCVDTAMVLKRTSKGTTLYVRGREIEETEHATILSPTDCRWTILGKAADIQRSDSRNAVINAFDYPSEQLSPTDLQTRTALKQEHVRKLLARMLEAGEIIKTGRGTYQLPE